MIKTKSGRDFTGYVIRTHKCGATTRVHVPGFAGNQITPAEIATFAGTLRDGARAFGTANPVYVMADVFVPCVGCGGRLRLDNFDCIYGRFVEEIVCNGACMAAKRSSCDCSCGGMNHGRAHGGGGTD